MTAEFFRFPHTPHIAWLGTEPPRADKVLSDCEVREFLSGPVIVEEKVDGANIGISIDREGVLRVQNRGAFLEPPYFGQFKHLESWLAPRRDDLFDGLGDQYILFGEWCAARHSISYDHLPDWFLAFDLLDRKTESFLSVERRNALIEPMGLVPIRQVAKGRFRLQKLIDLLRLERSAYHVGAVEGFYLRREAKGALIARTKLVRGDFVQGIDDHWRARAIEWNTLDVRATALSGTVRPG